MDEPEAQPGGVGEVSGALISLLGAEVERATRWKPADRVSRLLGSVPCPAVATGEDLEYAGDVAHKDMRDLVYSY